MIAIVFLIIALFIAWYVIRGLYVLVFPHTPAINQRAFHTPLYISWILILGLIGYNLFVYDTSLGMYTPTLGLAGANLIFLISLLLHMQPAKRSILVWLTVLISLLASVGLIFRANGFVQSVDGIVMLFAGILLFTITLYDRLNWHSLWLVKHIAAAVPALFQHLLDLPKKFSAAKTDRPQSVLFTWVKTLLITLLILFIFISLLSAADPVFSQLIADFRQQILGRSIGSLVLVVLVYLITTLKLTPNQITDPRLSWLSAKDVLIPLISLTILFGSFLAVQANYLFATQADFQQFGLTYSEYVRKGFLELLWTALLGGLLTHIMLLKLLELTDTKQRTGFKVVATVIIIQLLLLLASALKRDLMYVDTYGLTRVRIVGGVFLAWLAGLLALLAAKAWTDLGERRFLIGIGLISALTVVYLNVVNIDALVLAGSPSHHTYKDYFYTNHLSEDAFQGWIVSLPALTERVNTATNKPTLTEIEKSQLAGDKLALITLSEKLDRLNLQFGSLDWALDYCQKADCLEFNPNEQAAKKLNTPTKQLRRWQYTNLAKVTAYNRLQSQIPQIQTDIETALSTVFHYQRRTGLDLYPQEYRLLREFTYPFINIRLRYFPVPGRAYTTPVNVGDQFDSFQQARMAANSFLFSSLKTADCQTAADTIILTGMLKTSPDALFDQPGLQWYQFWDNQMKTSDAAVTIAASPSVFDASKQYHCYDQAGCGNHFGTATLTAKTSTDDSGCRVYYQISQWQEIPNVEPNATLTPAIKVP